MFKRFFKKDPPKKVRLTETNLKNWPYFYQKLQEGKLKFDTNGRLRYLHGAPVCDMVLVSITNDGTPKYKESTEEWFDPEGDMAKRFVWP